MPPIFSNSRSMSSDSRDESEEDNSYHSRNINCERLSRVNACMNANVNESNRKSYITFVLLCFINMLSYYDGVSVAGVLDDVKVYFSITASTAGLLQTSVNFLYLLACPLYGYLGDRYCRKLILASGIALWSSSTFASSFVPKNSFGTFLFLRTLVGFGAASCSVLAPTIIADLSHRNFRTNILSLFFFAVPIGSGLGYMFSSEVARWFKSWQWSQRVTPPIGLLCIILVLVIVKEPTRGHAEGAIRIQVTSIRNDFYELWKTRTFVWLTLAWTCYLFTTGAFSWWSVHFIQMSLDLQENLMHLNSGLIFGIMSCVAGILGILIGSFAAQFLRRCSQRADPLICGFSILTSVPFIFVALSYMETHFFLSMAFLFSGYTFLSMALPIVVDITLYVLVPTRRAFGRAVQLFISHLFGDVWSPYICGLIVDALLKKQTKNLVATNDYSSLQHSLYLPTFVLVGAGICFFISAFYVIEDKAKCSLVAAGVIPPCHVYANDLGMPRAIRLAADDVIPNDRAYLV